MALELRTDTARDVEISPPPAPVELERDDAVGGARDQAVQTSAQVIVAKLAASPELQPPATGESLEVPAPHAPKKSSRHFLRTIEHLIATSEQQVVKQAIKIAGGTRHLAIEVAEYVEVYAGEAVGVTELVGLRYPVKTYEAQVAAGLYRGSRLDEAGMAALKAQGIQGVVNLCLEHTEDARLAAKYGLAAINVKILDNSAPTIAQMHDFIAFARSHQPTYVHCEAGEGRTGVAVACYRIAVDGWTADQAIAEGRTFGLHLINQVDFIYRFARAAP